MEEEGVEKGNQGRTLATGSLVRDTEGAQGDNAAFRHCQGRLGVALIGHGRKPNGLAVRANGVT